MTYVIYLSDWKSMTSSSKEHQAEGNLVPSGTERIDHKRWKRGRLRRCRSHFI
jgi:hypothetical protein